MWAGGFMEWNPKSQIKLGDEVEQAVKVARAEEKAGMMFVYQARELAPKGGDWAVREERTHVFFPPKQEEAKGGAKPGGKKKPAGECIRIAGRQARKRSLGVFPGGAV